MTLSILFVAAIAACSATDVAEADYRPWIFEEVVSILRQETEGGADRIPALADPHRLAASKAKSAREELSVVHSLLEGIPSSHVGLFSRDAYEFFGRELLGEDSITPGFFLAEQGGDHFVSEVMRGGPADTAGLTVGDQLISIDGIAIALSPRLDLRSDDAHLPDRAAHRVLTGAGESVALEILRNGETLGVKIVPEAYSTLRSDRESATVIQHGEHKLGYARLSYLYRHHTSSLLRPILSEKLDACDGLLLDLRGRGGSQIAMWGLMSMFHGEAPLWTRPVVLLVDRDTRSAKEVFAAWFRKNHLGQIVGEKTIGAARPGQWFPVGDDYLLLCPREPFAEPRGIELVGVSPDITAKSTWPDMSAGDAILNRGIEVLIEELRKSAAESDHGSGEHPPSVPPGSRR